MGESDQTVHCRVNRWGCPTRAMQAVAKGRDHVVVVLLASEYVNQASHSIKAQDGKSGFGECPEVAAGSLNPHDLDRFTRDGVDDLTAG